LITSRPDKRGARLKHVSTAPRACFASQSLMSGSGEPPGSGALTRGGPWLGTLRTHAPSGTEARSSSGGAVRADPVGGTEPAVAGAPEVGGRAPASGASTGCVARTSPPWCGSRPHPAKAHAATSNVPRFGWRARGIVGDDNTLGLDTGKDHPRK